MKKTVLAMGLAIALVGCEKAAEPEVVADLSTQTQKVSYIMGLNVGMEVNQPELEIDTDALIQGIKDTLSGTEKRLSDEDIKVVIETFQQEFVAKQQAAQEAVGQENAAKGVAYLAENGAKEGVITTESGLQYSVVVEGTGPKPTEDSRVQVHYEGRHLDGSVFDSSLGGEPVSFVVARVIPGWTEALLLMSEGSKWEVAVPSELAYGPIGIPDGPIGANETLLFTIELLKSNMEDAGN